MFGLFFILELISVAGTVESHGGEGVMILLGISAALSLYVGTSYCREK